MDNTLTGPQKYAHEIVHECNEAWKKLISGEAPAGDISLANTTVQGSPGFTTSDDAPAANPQPAAPIDSSISKSFFISSASS